MKRRMVHTVYAVYARLGVINTYCLGVVTTYRISVCDESPLTDYVL